MIKINRMIFFTTDKIVVLLEYVIL
jgi:hypothetical protein